MKERPILFSTPMVQALLEGRKTQTRRIVQNAPLCPDGWYPDRYNGERKWTFWGSRNTADAGRCTLPLFACPYGDVGDRLWVRETFFASLSSVGSDSVADRPVAYKATPPAIPPSRWMPSIHLPRWASRILLEITDVRVERLHDITEQDAQAEGAFHHEGHGVGHTGWTHDRDAGLVYDTARDSFAHLWAKINGGKSWGDNPWVWVVSFKVVKP